MSMKRFDPFGMKQARDFNAPMVISLSDEQLRELKEKLQEWHNSDEYKAWMNDPSRWTVVERDETEFEWIDPHSQPCPDCERIKQGKK